MHAASDEAPALFDSTCKNGGPVVGAYFGTFDPVHEGHINLVCTAQQRLHLSKVYFIPNRAPRSKRLCSSLNVRLATLQHHPRFSGATSFVAMAPSVDTTLKGKTHICKEIAQSETLVHGTNVQVVLLIGDSLLRAQVRDLKDFPFAVHIFPRLPDDAATSGMESTHLRRMDAQNEMLDAVRNIYRQVPHLQIAVHKCPDVGVNSSSSIWSSFEQLAFPSTKLLHPTVAHGLTHSGADPQLMYEVQMPLSGRNAPAILRPPRDLKRTAIIIMGQPGSGTTTLAHSLCEMGGDGSDTAPPFTYLGPGDWQRAGLDVDGRRKTLRPDYWLKCLHTSQLAFRCKMVAVATHHGAKCSCDMVPYVQGLCMGWANPDLQPRGRRVQATVRAAAAGGLCAECARRCAAWTAAGLIPLYGGSYG